MEVGDYWMCLDNHNIIIITVFLGFDSSLIFCGADG